MMSREKVRVKRTVSTTRILVGSVAIVTVVLFSALIVQSLDPFAPKQRSSIASSRVDDVTKVADDQEENSAAEPVVAHASVSFGGSGADVQNRLAELAEENRDLLSSNQLLEDRLTAVLNWILVNFRGKFPLPESFMGNVSVPPLTDEFSLNPELAEFLKVTGEEELQINDAFAYAYDYLREIETAFMTVSSPRQGKVILHIPAFEEDGQLLKEDLYTALEVTLGQSRFDRFLKVSEEGLKDNFYQFGEASRTMVFELAYVDDNPYPQLKIKDGYVINLDAIVRNVTATETFVTNMPPEYSAYVAWLPDYISAYAEQ